MSRRTKARRRARKARALTLRSKPIESSAPWGSAPPLTAEERARVVARYSHLRGRSFCLSFVLLPIWVRAGTPEELLAAVTARLLEDSQAKLKS